ncbi:hypothetical protein LXL04_003489 [Taraxacum kok-saghyz]
MSFAIWSNNSGMYSFCIAVLKRSIRVGSGNCGGLVSCDRIQSLHLFSLIFPSSRARQREKQHPSTSPISPFCLSSTSSSSREPCLRCFFSRAAAPEHSNPRRNLHSNSNSGGPWQLPAPSVFSASPEEIGDRFIPPIYRFCCLFRSAPGLISSSGSRELVTCDADLLLHLHPFCRHPLHQLVTCIPCTSDADLQGFAGQISSFQILVHFDSIQQFEFLQGFAGQIEFDSLKQVTGSNARFKFNVLNQNRDKWKRQGQMEDRRWTNGSARDKWTNQIIVNQHVTLVVFQTFKMYGGAKNIMINGFMQISKSDEGIGRKLTGDAIVEELAISGDAIVVGCRLEKQSSSDVAWRNNRRRMSH